MWRIEFVSAKFLPFLPEENQSNPGVYGFELASWLSQSLAQRGVVTTYPLQEDWGWLLQHARGDLEFLIGCSSVCGEGDGYEGNAITWSIFVDAVKSLKQKLGSTAVDATAEGLAKHITGILDSEGLKWELV
jgi:hypothetical protein